MKLKLIKKFQCVFYGISDNKMHFALLVCILKEFVNMSQLFNSFRIVSNFLKIAVVAGHACNAYTLITKQKKVGPKVGPNIDADLLLKKSDPYIFSVQPFLHDVYNINFTLQ